MRTRHERSGPGVILGVTALAVALGSLHAFSVLLAPLELQLGTGRAAVSLIYSVSILALTAGVLVSDRIRERLSPSSMALLVATTGGLGLGLSALATSYPIALLGFGLLFGVANGIGYTLFLDQAARALPGRAGLAVGLSTASYAVGAMSFSWVFAELVTASDARHALLADAVAVLLAGLIGWAAFDRTRGAEPTKTPEACGTSSERSAGLTVRLWLIYFLGATGGLMAIAHAAGIVTRLGATGDAVAQSAVAMALGNAAGSVLGGGLADYLPQRLCLTVLIGLGGLSSLVVAGTTSIPLAIVALLGVGFAYGGLIALIPVVVARLAPAGQAPQIFGRVFTAWGAAGLLGPWIAGAGYDWSGQYQPALLGAAALSGLGAVASYVFLGSSGRPGS